MSEFDSDPPDAGNQSTEEALRSWMASIGGGPAVRIEVFRVAPKVFEGRRISGLVGVLEELPEHQDLFDEFGGGRYQLRIKRPDEIGRYVYFGSVNVAVPGVPRVDVTACPVAEPDVLPLQDHERRLARIEKRLQRVEEALDLATGAPEDSPTSAAGAHRKTRRR